MQDSSDPVNRLVKAACTLEEYCQKLLQAKSASPLQKTIALFRSLVLDKKLQKEELLQAIEIVNRERFFIQTLKLGTTEERDLADGVTRAIEAYNLNRDSFEADRTNLTSGLTKYFRQVRNINPSFRLPKIDLPEAVSVSFQYPNPFTQPLIQEKDYLVSKSASNVQISKQCVELFQMKALTLLARHNIASNPEARSQIKHTPILSTVDTEALTCTLVQKLKLFPGQTIVVMGTSLFDPKTQTACRLLPETFSISLKSTQTGSPHPSQRTGFASAGQLMPESPQRKDLLPSLSSFFRRKKQLKANLLPNGSLLPQAKQLLKLKKIAFEANSHHFISLHRKLTLALLKAAPLHLMTAASFELCSQFCDILDQKKEPFEFISDTYQQMQHAFIAKPHQQLMSTIIQKKIPNTPHDRVEFCLGDADRLLQNGIDASKKWMEQHLSDHIQGSHEYLKWNYIICLGTVMGSSSKQIILQYLSEDLFYSPPSLNLFEKKMQAAAYAHVEDFITELHLEMSQCQKENIEVIDKSITEALIRDITLFEQECDLFVPDALSNYYQSRYTKL